MPCIKIHANAWHSLVIKTREGELALGGKRAEPRRGRRRWEGGRKTWTEKTGKRHKKGRETKENRKRTGKRTRQRRVNFLPLFLLKGTEVVLRLFKSQRRPQRKRDHYLLHLQHHRWKTERKQRDNKGRARTEKSQGGRMQPKWTMEKQRNCKQRTKPGEQRGSWNRCPASVTRSHRKSFTIVFVPCIQVIFSSRFAISLDIAAVKLISLF